MNNERYKMDAEIDMYLNEMLSLNWYLSRQYLKPENQRIKPTIDKCWAKINSNKSKIARKIERLKQEINRKNILSNNNE